MVERDKILELLKEQPVEGLFPVAVSVSLSDTIKVVVDSLIGLTLDDCVKVSRYLEQQLDRDKEDFELEVSSPGLTEPFKVKEQYYKNRGKEIILQTIKGEEIKGLLREAEADYILIEQKTREKTEGHKKKQLIIKENKLKYEDIRSAKVIVTFK
jgi:ribosome maturation factor RimP